MQLNIENEVFASTRLTIFARKMDWDKYKALGKLAYFWHQSQEAMMYLSSTEEISIWFDLFEDLAAAQKLMEALSHPRVRYITATRDGVQNINSIDEVGDINFWSTIWKISGNKKHIDKLKNIIKRNKQIARQRWSKNKQSPKTVTTTEEYGVPTGIVLDTSSSPARVEDAQLQYSSVQFSSDQFSSEHNNTSADTPRLADATANVKTAKNKRRKVPKIWLEKITDSDRKLAQEWVEYAQGRYPKRKFDVEQFAFGICKTRSECSFSDGDGNTQEVTQGQMEWAFKWMKQDKFWKSVAYSAYCLLKPSKADSSITKGQQLINGIVRERDTRKKSVSEKSWETAQKVADGTAELIDIGGGDTIDMNNYDSSWMDEAAAKQKEYLSKNLRSSKC